MYLTYTLKNGEKILVFLGGDILSSKKRTTHFYPMASDGYYYVSDEATIDIDVNGKGESYFFYNGTLKYLKDFDSITFDKLIKKTNSWINVNSVTTTEILTAFMKYKEEVGLLINFPIYEKITKSYSNVKNENKKIFFVLTEEELSNGDWFHTIELKCKEGTYKINFPYLASLIKRREVKLVDKNEYIELLNNIECKLILYFKNHIFEYEMDKLDKDFVLPSDIIGFSILCKYIDPITNDIKLEDTNRCFINDEINYEKLSDNIKKLIKDCNGKTKKLNN